MEGENILNRMVKVGVSHVKIRVKSIPGREVSLSAGKDVGNFCVSQNTEQSKLGREHVSNNCIMQGPAGQRNLLVLNTMFNSYGLIICFTFY